MNTKEARERARRARKEAPREWYAVFRNLEKAVEALADEIDLLKSRHGSLSGQARASRIRIIVDLDPTEDVDPTNVVPTKANGQHRVVVNGRDGVVDRLPRPVNGQQRK